ncbi:MAG: hypothetical protein ACYTEE_11960 [Planctomycetota bacterium]
MKWNDNFIHLTSPSGRLDQPPASVRMSTRGTVLCVCRWFFPDGHHFKNLPPFCRSSLTVLKRTTCERGCRPPFCSPLIAGLEYRYPSWSGTSDGAPSSLFLT